MQKTKNLLLLLLTVVLVLTGCTSTKSDISNYLNTGSSLDEDAVDIMPDLSELADYKNIDYVHTHKSMIIFESDSVVLNVEYDKDIYEKEIEKLDEKYAFFKNDYDEKNSSGDEYRFLIDNYEFRIVASEDSNSTGIPKSFGMIGTSSEDSSIAYLYYFDFDLDYIWSEDEDKDEAMKKFVKENFDYQF